MESQEDRTVGVFVPSSERVEELGSDHGDRYVDNPLVCFMVGEIGGDPNFWTTQDGSEPEIERLRRPR